MPPAQTGVIVRWVVFLVAFVAIMAFVLGGYYHAKSRIRRGLPPLAYHRVSPGLGPISLPSPF